MFVTRSNRRPVPSGLARIWLAHALAETPSTRAFAPGDSRSRPMVGIKAPWQGRHLGLRILALISCAEAQLPGDIIGGAAAVPPSSLPPPPMGGVIGGRVGAGCMTTGRKPAGSG